MSVRVALRPAATPITQRVRQICWQFGLVPGTARFRLLDGLRLRLEAGQILFLTGPSGSGKSATLRQLGHHLGPAAVWIETQRFAAGSAIVDQIAPRRDLAEVLSILTACGLGEPRLWLRRYADLSDGEKFRARLAMAAAKALSKPGSVLLIDEFCAILHRRLACAIAFNLRKFVTRTGLRIAAATTHDDLLGDLQPDQLLRLGAMPPRLECPPRRPRPISFFRRLHISVGKLKDYENFKPMHYRQRAGLGPVDKVFVMRDGVGGDALGIVVYGYVPLSLRLRNRITGGAYHRNGRALNRDFRILRRLVIHPDVRGCGLGHWLVAKTLPLVGCRYVECLAAMGAVNPVFERAGMVRVGSCGLPSQQRRLRESLLGMGVDPLAEDFARIVARRRAVRRLIEKAVHGWLQATTGRAVEQIRSIGPRGLAAAFVQLMGAEPVYYIWSADRAELCRLREAAEALKTDDQNEPDQKNPGGKSRTA